MTTVTIRPASVRFRRTLRALRYGGIGLILLGPIAQAAWAIHRPAPSGVTLRETPAQLGETASARTPASVARAAEYLSHRSPSVDRLLPEGSGGTRFYETLDGDAGQAFLGTAAIGLSASSDPGIWPEAVEVHERAHLAEASLPVEVARLMARVSAPAGDEYAATNSGEHFAEMAARAWEIVMPPTNVCIDGTPTERLAIAESRVPGTAGFVVRFLTLLPAGDVDQELQASAARLSEPQRKEWAAIWRGIDARRRPDGTFEPWPRPGVRQYLEAEQIGLKASDRWIDRLIGLLLTPSLTFARIGGWL